MVSHIYDSMELFLSFMAFITLAQLRFSYS
jgi:hypothetical protein